MVEYIECRGPMPPIFNNKKIYLRRKSARLMTRLMIASIPLVIGAGVFVIYHRSPENLKYLTAAK